MVDNFDKEFLNIEREITRLKTSAQKSATLVQTVSQQLNIEASLSLGTGASTPVAVKVIYYEILTEKTALVIPTLDWYYQNIYDAWQTLPSVPSRYIDMTQIILPNSNNGLKIAVFGTNSGTNNDAERLMRGETVTIGFKLSIRCTCNFTIREFQ